MLEPDLFGPDDELLTMKSELELLDFTFEVLTRVFGLGVSSGELLPLADHLKSVLRSSEDDEAAPFTRGGLVADEAVEED